MAEDVYLKRIMTSVLLAMLLVLCFFLLKPILLSIVFGVILVFLFAPLYNWLSKIIKSRNLTTTIICLLLLAIIIIPVWFFTPMLIDQSFKIYQSIQSLDLVGTLKAVFPSLFASESFSAQAASILHSFLSNTANSVVNVFADLILDFPNLSLQLLVMAFTFFYVLRDKDELIAYIKTILPFSKDVESKIFEYSKGITWSVLYGQVVIGAVQGLITGVGFFVFGVPNALFLTLIAMVLGILPILGTFIVWLPAAVYMIVNGGQSGTFAAVGIAIFGLVGSVVEHLLRTIIISRRTSLHSGLVLIGMIGGLYLFGALGVLLGPLIIAYLVILLEVYRNSRVPGLLIPPEPSAAK